MLYRYIGTKKCLAWLESGMIPSAWKVSNASWLNNMSIKTVYRLRKSGCREMLTSFIGPSQLACRMKSGRVPGINCHIEGREKVERT